LRDTVRALPPFLAGAEEEKVALIIMGLIVLGNNGKRIYE
jgi:hypothetical protein